MDTSPRITSGDIVAGLSVAFILVPQSLAYAELAGLPAYIGLYAAALPPLAAAFFASSPYLQTGPVAMTSLLTFGALSSLAVVQSSEYVALAALLALMVGVIRLALGLLRAGVVAYFMSQPVLIGFTSAAAILIISSQLPTALGVDPPHEKLIANAWWSIVHPSDWEGTALVLAVVTVTLVLVGRRLHPLFPGVLVAVAAGLAYSKLTDYSGAVVGEVPGKLIPPFSLGLPWSDLTDLLIPGIVIALVGFAEPAAIARTFAAQDRRSWSPNREFVSQGVANLASGISGGLPVGGSFSRSSINRMAGGKTRWSGAVTGLAVLAFLPAARIVTDLPRAILAAIVIGAVLKLIQLADLVRIVRYSRPQALVAWTTFALTLALSPRIDQAVMVGIGLGIAVHLWRELQTEVNARLEGTTLIVEPVGVLYFGSAPDLDRTLVTQLAAHPTAERLVIDLSQLGRIDYTGALALRGFVGAAEQAGLEVEIVGIPPPALRIITRVWKKERTPVVPPTRPI